jgi:hypothetical protein
LRGAGLRVRCGSAAAALCFLCLGFALFARPPASAQTADAQSGDYTGTNVSKNTCVEGTGLDDPTRVDISGSSIVIHPTLTGGGASSSNVAFSGTLASNNSFHTSATNPQDSSLVSTIDGSFSRSGDLIQLQATLHAAGNYSVPGQGTTDTGCDVSFTATMAAPSGAQAPDTSQQSSDTSQRSSDTTEAALPTGSSSPGGGGGSPVGPIAGAIGGVAVLAYAGHRLRRYANRPEHEPDAAPGIDMSSDAPAPPSGDPELARLTAHRDTLCRTAQSCADIIRAIQARLDADAAEAQALLQRATDQERQLLDAANSYLRRRELETVVVSAGFAGFVTWVGLATAGTAPTAVKGALTGLGYVAPWGALSLMQDPLQLAGMPQGDPLQVYNSMLAAGRARIDAEFSQKMDAIKGRVASFKAEMARAKADLVSALQRVAADEAQMPAGFQPCAADLSGIQL